MRLLLAIVVLAQSLVVTIALAARLPLEKLGMSEPFYSKNLNVVWSAPTNHLPSTVRVFKVVPSKYSPVVISNLMALGEFTERDRVKAFVPEYPLPRSALGYLKEAEKRSLSIAPNLGLVRYRDEKAEAAIHPREPVEGLPDDGESVRLALMILPRLGIDLSDLAAKADGVGPCFSIGPGSRGYFDRAKGKYVKEETLRRVSFTRQLDGLPIVGGGRQGIDVTFGNHGRISELVMNWRSVEHVGSYPCAGREQMIGWIREGRARVQSMETTGARWVKASDIKRLTITAISPQYFAGGSEERLDRMHPYAMLKAEAEIGTDDKETIWLFCPVTAEGLNRPSRKSDGFCVYPGAFNERLARTSEATTN